MRTMTPRLLAAVLALAGATAFAVPARAEKGAMEIGLAARYAWPQMDLSRLEPGLDYGVIFHYWLNSTTTVDVGIDSLTHRAPLMVDGAEQDLIFQTYVVEVGMRYRPKLDFFLQPFAELGVGYQFWSVDLEPSALDDRSGSAMAYYAGLGLDYPFLGQFSAGIDARYWYLPMQESLEEKVSAIGGDETKTDLRNAGFLAAGIELTWKFK